MMLRMKKVDRFLRFESCSHTSLELPFWKPAASSAISSDLLPNVLANPLARLEPYGMAILIGILIVLPLLGSQLGVDLSFVSHLISSATGTVIRAILRLTGNM